MSSLPLSPLSPGALTISGVAVAAKYSTHSVVDHGAVGDGSTDDTAAIQAAVDAACADNGSVFFPNPSSYYKVTSTINIKPAGTNTQVACDLLAEGEWDSCIRWAGANSTAVFKALGWKRSIVQSVKILIPATSTGVVAWDIDCDGTYGSTSHVTFVNCSVNLRAGAASCVCWRGGHSGGADCSFITFVDCRAEGNRTGDSNIGWVTENANVLNWVWFGGGATYIDTVCTNISTAGAANAAGGGDMWWFGFGGTLNLTSFEFTTSGTYGIYGGRWESGKTFLAGFTGGGSTASTVTISGVRLSGWLGDASGRVFRMGQGGALNLEGVYVTKSTGAFDANMITVSCAANKPGALNIQGGCYDCADPMYTVSAGDWSVNIRGATIVDAAGVNGSRAGNEKLAFNGVTAAARAVLATGASHTVDDVITALQNLGLVKQS